MEDAKRLLTHYFRMVWEKAGLKWDSDNDAEVEDIIDYLADGIKKEVAREIIEAIEKGDENNGTSSN